MSSPKPFYQDGFLRGLIGMVILASFLPSLGCSGGLLHIDAVSDIGIALVFFLHGMGIPSEHMRAGLSRWPVHLVVQGTTFVLFPLLGWLCLPLLQHLLPRTLALGFFYLAALPSTISSSVALTGVARGNVPAAIFNATLSSLLGIVLTPLLVSLIASNNGHPIDPAQAVAHIATLLLLPFVAGQLLHASLGAWFARYRKLTTLFDKGVILLLVLNAFSDSVKGGLWVNYGAGLLLETAALAALLLAAGLIFSRQLARRLKFSTEDEIVAVFCGSKKTLAAGMPMAKALFGSYPDLGLIVLPIMLYHQLQLIACTSMAARYANRQTMAVNGED